MNNPDPTPAAPRPAPAAPQPKGERMSELERRTLRIRARQGELFNGQEWLRALDHIDALAAELATAEQERAKLQQQLEESNRNRRVDGDVEGQVNAWFACYDALDRRAEELKDYPGGLTGTQVAINRINWLVDCAIELKAAQQQLAALAETKDVEGLARLGGYAAHRVNRNAMLFDSMPKEYRAATIAGVNTVAAHVRAESAQRIADLEKREGELRKELEHRGNAITAASEQLAELRTKLEAAEKRLEWATTTINYHVPGEGLIDAIRCLVDRCDQWKQRAEAAEALAKRLAAELTALQSRHDGLRRAVTEVDDGDELNIGIHNMLRRMKYGTIRIPEWRWFAWAYDRLQAALAEQPAPAPSSPEAANPIPAKPDDCDCWFPSAATGIVRVGRLISTETKHAQDCPAHLRIASDAESQDLRRRLDEADGDGDSPRNDGPPRASSPRKAEDSPRNEAAKFVCPACGSELYYSADCSSGKIGCLHGYMMGCGWTGTWADVQAAKAKAAKPDHSGDGDEKVDAKEPRAGSPGAVGNIKAESGAVNGCSPETAPAVGDAQVPTYYIVAVADEGELWEATVWNTKEGAQECLAERDRSDDEYEPGIIPVVHKSALDAAFSEIERLRQRLLTAAGDDLCRLSQEEIKDLTGGKVQIPPKDEFLASCERFHAQVASESGVNQNCLTLAQLVAENEQLRRRIDAVDGKLPKWLVYTNSIGCLVQDGPGRDFYRTRPGRTTGETFLVVPKDFLDAAEAKARELEAACGAMRDAIEEDVVIEESSNGDRRLSVSVIEGIEDMADDSKNRFSEWAKIVLPGLQAALSPAAGRAFAERHAAMERFVAEVRAEVREAIDEKYGGSLAIVGYVRLALNRLDQPQPPAEAK